MSGALALHGGGEFLPGDEPFLRAILALARDAARRPPAVIAAVVPVAAARQRPDLAAAHGVEALRRVGDEIGIALEVEPVLVVDADSADDPELADRLAAVDLVHLPGGEPDLVPAVLGGSRAWAAIADGHARGAVVAGASAGAMAMAEVTWTPGGFVAGLGLARGFVIVPHFEHFDERDRTAEAAIVRQRGLGVLGLDERTGAIRDGRGRWRVAGSGRAIWIPPDGERIVARDGEVLPIPG